MSAVAREFIRFRLFIIELADEDMVIYGVRPESQTEIVVFIEKGIFLYRKKKEKKKERKKKR